MCAQSCLEIAVPSALRRGPFKLFSALNVTAWPGTSTRGSVTHRGEQMTVVSPPPPPFSPSISPATPRHAPRARSFAGAGLFCSADPLAYIRPWWLVCFSRVVRRNRSTVLSWTDCFEGDFPRGLHRSIHIAPQLLGTALRVVSFLTPPLPLSLHPLPSPFHPSPLLFP